MSKKKKKFKKRPEIKKDEPMAFSFCEPKSVHDINVLDCLSTGLDSYGKYYRPPISLPGLAKMPRVNAHHGSCLIFRRNALVNEFITNGALSLKDFDKAVTDLLNFGQAYLQKITNVFGNLTGLRHVPAINTRIGKKDGQFFYLRNGQEPLEFAKNELIAISNYDTNQQIYGVPDWLGAMQSALLNEDATLFRRRYYANGAHLGYLLYTTGRMDPDSVDKIDETVTGAKGIGNFNAMHVHSPNGHPDGVKILSVGDINQKDHFDTIKNISADDVIVAHRVHPALVAVKPESQSGFGDPEKIEIVYRRTETLAATRPWMALNEQLPPNLQFKFKISEES